MRDKKVDRKRNAKHPAKVLTFSRGRAAGPFRRYLQRSAPGPPCRAHDSARECAESRTRRALDLGENLDDDAAILRATGLRLVRRDRLLLAVADDADLVERHLVLFVEIAFHSFRTLETELVVHVCPT